MDELIERWKTEGGLLPITRVPGHALAAVAEAADLAVLPVGAVEWHGPHLPLGTDLLLAEGFAGELATGTARAVLFPAAPYAACPGQTRPWPGTVALRPEIAVGYLSDVLAGIVEAGFPRLLVVNGHDANLSTVRAAMEWVSGRHLASLLLVNWFQLVSPDETGEIFGTLPARGHGGAYESSAVLGFDPEAVHLAATPDLPPKPKLPTPYPYVLVESRPDPWQGWSGHVSLANETAGRRIRQLAGTRLREVIEAWLTAPLPSPPGTDQPGWSDRPAWSDRPDGTGRSDQAVG
ncbi:creatininase family protein [Micromonospora sp. NPDC051196]|uniref:creatininase family protein n=1 Tax=Micromonospora sp. NPDC051196 TaxID=3155281 RepID=UPI0034175FBB